MRRLGERDDPRRHQRLPHASHPVDDDDGDHRHHERRRHTEQGHTNHLGEIQRTDPRGQPVTVDRRPQPSHDRRHDEPGQTAQGEENPEPHEARTVEQVREGDGVEEVALHESVVRFARPAGHEHHHAEPHQHALRPDGVDAHAGHGGQVPPRRAILHVDRYEVLLAHVPHEVGAQQQLAGGAEEQRHAEVDGGQREEIGMPINAAPDAQRPARRNTSDSSSELGEPSSPLSHASVAPDVKVYESPHNIWAIRMLGKLARLASMANAPAMPA